MSTAIKTAGTSTTTVLVALQWQPSSGSQWTQDLAALNAYVTGLATVTGTMSKTIFPIPRITNEGLLIVGTEAAKITVGSWIVVDPVTGYPFMVPASVFTGGSFVHS